MHLSLPCWPINPWGPVRIEERSTGFADLDASSFAIEFRQRPPAICAAASN
jgi:hypothetical protein